MYLAKEASTHVIALLYFLEIVHFKLWNVNHTYVVFCDGIELSANFNQLKLSP